MFTHDPPEGMSIADFRSHPVTQTLRNAAARNGSGLPSKADLDALKLPADVRRLLAVAAEEVSGLFQTGEQEDARSLADEYSARLLGSLAKEYRDPSYLVGPHPTESMSPGELADLVRSGGYR